MIKIMLKKNYEELYNDNMSNIAKKLSIALENDMLKKRVKEVEDSYQVASGMTIRQEITKVFAKFDKKEMIIMLAGVQALLRTATSTGDMDYYMTLLKKIQGFIDNMEEE